MLRRLLTGSLLLATGGLACNGGGGGGGSGGTDSGTDSGSSGADCVEGQESCPCTAAGGCDDGLECISDYCVMPVEPFCGDGVLQQGETCDAGIANADTGLCKSDCTLQECGDGFVGPGEACDDGNSADDDECTSACALPTCGNEVVEGEEECDDGNKDDSDACLSSCMSATCGDGAIQAGMEECDDGDGMDDNGCSNACELQPFCGDGLVAPGELCFLPPIGVTVLGGPVDVEIGDVAVAGTENAADIIVTVGGADQVRILAGNGDGLFQEVNRYDVGANPADTALGRINSDGVLDFATVNTDDNSITVYMGLDTGDVNNLFGPATVFSDATLGLNGPLAVATGDLDGDNHDDVAVANYLDLNGATNLSLLFGAASINAMQQVDHMDAVDLGFNNPGANGVAFGTFDGSTPAFLVTERDANRLHMVGPGVGLSGVIENTFNLAPDTAPRRIASGAIDGDGATDVVFGTWHQPSCDYVANPNVCNSDDGKLYFGVPGSMNLEDLKNIVLGKAPTAGAVGDFNNDGNPDVVFASRYSNRVEVVITDGNRNIGTPESIAIDGAEPNSIAVGDLNNDGLDDIVTAQSYTNNVSVLLSNP